MGCSDNQLVTSVQASFLVEFGSFFDIAAFIQITPIELWCLQHVYIPVLFYAGVDYIDAPTPYLMGLQSGVDTSQLSMDGVSSHSLDLKLASAIRCLLQGILGPFSPGNHSTVVRPHCQSWTSPC
jgi:hypothetical protein